MYNFFQYEFLNKEYLKGIKRIKHITSSPRITLSKGPSIQLKQMAYSYVSFFNKKGKLIHTINLQTNNKYFYTYDKYGNPNRILEVDKDTNQLISENRLKFNIHNKVIKEDIKEIHNGITEKIIYKYRKNIIITKKYSSDEGLLYKIIDDYNDKKQLIQSKTESYNGDIYFDKYVYNSNGQEILNYSADGEDKFTVDNCIETTYYNNGLIKSWVELGENGFIHNCEYVFDEDENWIQQTLYFDGIPKFIYERELEYY